MLRAPAFCDVSLQLSHLTRLWAAVHHGCQWADAAGCKRLLPLQRMSGLSGRSLCVLSVALVVPFHFFWFLQRRAILDEDLSLTRLSSGSQDCRGVRDRMS